MHNIFKVLWGTEPISAVQEFFGTGWTWFFQLVTLFGAHEVVAVVITLALWLSGRRLAYALLGIVFFAMATDMLLWQVIGVPRPSGPGIIVYTQAPVSSFPSGHVVVATTVWGLLAMYGRIPKLAVALIVLVVMISRLYLGLHYLGDVLGGVLIGLFLLGVYSRL
jgi:membrane-associated phospholipid phosphatase